VVSVRPPTDNDGVSSVEESKERWDTLQAEYEEYRESLCLLRRIAAGTETAAPK
jgi:hypothetical protein